MAHIELKVILIVLFIVALVILGPLAMIWALNTLFPALAIPYTVETWLAWVLIAGVARSNVSINK